MQTNRRKIWRRRVDGARTYRFLPFGFLALLAALSLLAFPGIAIGRSSAPRPKSAETKAPATPPEKASDSKSPDAPRAAVPPTPAAAPPDASPDVNIDPQRRAYADQVRANGYNFRFGKDKPFLPSNATIEGNDFISPGAFPTAEYCGHCHQEAYHQWRESLHSNSFRAPFYRRNVDILIKEKGIEYSRHCEGCHNPIALLSGAVTQNSKVPRNFDNAGITCSVCHSVQKLQATYGLGSYVMGVPAVMVDEQGKRIPGEVSFDQIMAHPERHSAAVMRTFYRSPEFCASCHKANLPKSLTSYKWLRAIGLYDEWQGTSLAKQSPLPFYVKDYQSCQDCHMKKAAVELTDYGSKDGKLASHRWLGGNTAVPFFYKFDDQLQKTVEFLKATTLQVDLFALAKQGDKGSSTPAVLAAPLGTTAFSIAPADVLQAYVVIQNKGVGHTLIPEQRDFYEAWVEFEVKDASGQEIAHSGFLNGDGTLDQNAHSFTNRLVDKSGKFLANHEIWDRRAIAYDSTIPHGRSTLVRYEFQVPKNAQGPLTITAKVNYRHFRQDYLNFVLGADHPAYPVVAMASRTRIVQLGQNPVGEHDPLDNPEWMRWNNFGIALFDQQQYADALRAFTKVSEMRPDYRDAFTNIALADFSWQKYDDARAALNQALKLAPGNARALFYLAMVERNLGNLDAAIVNLQAVVEKFPKSKDAHRELGYSYFQKHEYAKAKVEYEALQQIDPDDLAAHYNLAIVYRRLGMKEQAAEQSAMFAEKKDDPSAATAALDFLRKHPQISNESVPWHVHSSVSGLANAPLPDSVALPPQ